LGRAVRLPLPTNVTAMLIRISDPAAVPALIRALSERVDYVVERRRADTVAASVLGSFADAGELDLALFLAAWQAAHPEVRIDVLED
jgi:HEAT repeat protein